MFPPKIRKSAMKKLRKLYFGIRLLALLPKLGAIKPNNADYSSKAIHCRTEVDSLRQLFNHHGSDKAIMHNYFEIYAPVMGELAGGEIRVLEIGLGTNNAKIPSNMGGFFTPGGSLRAIKDFVPNAEIYGADIDNEILFNETNIQTCWIDQTKTRTYGQLRRLLQGKSLDIVIVDGLHQPFADLNSLCVLLPYIKIFGYLFIEDIEGSRLILLIWAIISKLLPSKHYKTDLLRMKGGYIFQVARVDLG